MKYLILNVTFLLLIGYQIVACTGDTLDYQVINNIPYTDSEDPLQQLNLLLPKGAQSAPLLIWIGGGAWAFVDRHKEMSLARKFAREGIAVASVGHRLSPGTWADPGKTTGVKHPVHVQDIAVAFKWLYEHGKEYGYDPENIFIGGFSSGAHLTALLGSDKRYLEKHGLSLNRIKGLIPVAGAYDISAYHQTFLNHEDSKTRAMADSHVKAVFGNTEADFKDASPTSYMDNLSIPMLLVSEGALFNYTRIYEERIWESDFRNCQIYHVFDLDHGGLWKNLSFSKDSRHRDLMVQFIRQQAGKPGLVER